MADLPEFKVAVGEPPVSHVGVDFFGPMQVKRGRSTVKRWGCIVTYLVVRAVHLEVVFFYISISKIAIHATYTFYYTF